MNKTHYSYLCEKCFKDLGKPLDYKYKYYESIYPCVANDRLGDDDNDKDYVLCSICKDKIYGYYERAYPENVLVLDSLEEYETILKEDNIVIVYFVRGSEFKYYNLNGYEDNPFIFLLIDLEREKGQEIAKKESVDEICYLIYLNGKRIKVLKECSKFAFEYEIRKIKDFIESKKTFTSKYHDHELKNIQLKEEVECSICKRLVETYEDEVYSCIQCDFILCNCCKGEEEGKTDIKKEYVFEPLKNSDEYYEIIKNNKKVAVFFYSKFSGFKEEVNIVKELKNEFPEVKFYKIYTTESISIIKMCERSGSSYYYKNGVLTEEPKIYEKKIEPEKGYVYFLEDGIFKDYSSIDDSSRLNLALIEFCGRDYEKIKSKRHFHLISKVKMISFNCRACKKKFTDKDEPLLKTVYKCIGCSYNKDFELCEECRKKELEEN